MSNRQEERQKEARRARAKKGLHFQKEKAYANYKAAKRIPLPLSNGDERRYASKGYFSQFTKGMLHDLTTGILVSTGSYKALIKAAKSGRSEDYDKIAIAGKARLVNPQGGNQLGFLRPDPQATFMPPAPLYTSDEQGAEVLELYWQARLRDQSLLEFQGVITEATPQIILQACDELSRVKGLKHMADSGVPAYKVTPQTLFRCDFPGVSVGPYISQYLLQDCPFGATSISIKLKYAKTGKDYMTTWEEFINIQNGGSPSGPQLMDPNELYICTGRHLTHYVHVDVVNQSFL